jgi:hypothetical protein
LLSLYEEFSSSPRRKQKAALKAPDGARLRATQFCRVLQYNDLPLAELTSTFHTQHSRVVHINPATIPSGIDRRSFNQFRERYWKDRAKDFE